MGFTAGLYTYPKIDGYRFCDVVKIERYYNYYRFDVSRKFSSQDFSGPEDYMNYNSSRKYSKDEAELFRIFVHEENYSNMIGCEVDTWGSCFGNIWSWACSKFKVEDGCVIDLSKSDLIDLLKHCWDEYSYLTSTSYSVVRGFTYLEDDEIRSTKIDGIEVEDENGSLRRLDTNLEWGGKLMASPEGLVDDYYMTSLKSVIDALLKIINIDFDHNGVALHGGY